MTRSNPHISNPNDYYGLHPSTLKDHYQDIGRQGRSDTPFSLLVPVQGDSESPILNDSALGGRRQSVQRVE